MPTKKVPKATPIPGSSRGDEGPSTAVQLPQSISDLISKVPVIKGLDPEDLPKLSKERMPVPKFTLIYTTYRWIDSDGRLIVFEEIQGMLCIMYGKADPFLVADADEYSTLFDHLESEQMLRILGELDDDKKETLKSLAQALFDQLLRDPENEKRVAHLRGFPERMRYLPWNKEGYPWYAFPRPTFAGHELRDDQVYTIFALHWLKDIEGNDISELDAATMVCRLYSYAYIPVCALFECLGISNHSITLMVEQYISDSGHTAFFERKAHAIHKLCTKEERLQIPAPLIPDQDLVPTTTADMGAMSMSMGVTAEPQSIEFQDKGKQKRQGESSSESPPAGSSAVKKGKKPEKKRHHP